MITFRMVRYWNRLHRESVAFPSFDGPELGWTWLWAMWFNQPCFEHGTRLMTFHLKSIYDSIFLCNIPRCSFLNPYFKLLYVLILETLSQTQFSSLLIWMLCGTLLKAYFTIHYGLHLLVEAMAYYEQIWLCFMP